VVLANIFITGIGATTAASSIEKNVVALFAVAVVLVFRDVVLEA